MEIGVLLAYLGTADNGRKPWALDLQLDGINNIILAKNTDNPRLEKWSCAGEPLRHASPHPLACFRLKCRQSLRFFVERTIPVPVTDIEQTDCHRVTQQGVSVRAIAYTVVTVMR
jgi:hypothetical protein